MQPQMNPGIQSPPMDPGMQPPVDQGMQLMEQPEDMVQEEEKEEELLFDMQHIQTDEPPHIDLTEEEQAPTPEVEHLATAGPPPPPADYNPQGVGYMVMGPTYLLAAQDHLFVPVYPGVAPGVHATQVSMLRLNTQGLKPPKWNEEKQALAKWLQDIIMYFRTTQTPRH